MIALLTPFKEMAFARPGAKSVLAAVLAATVPAPAGAAEAEAEPAPAITVRVYEMAASGLDVHDCTVRIEIHNHLDRLLEGFAATLVLSDSQGEVVARKAFETTRIPPGARRREGLAFKLLPERRAEVRDFGELASRCDLIALAGLELRACDAGGQSIFPACLDGLRADPASAPPLTIRRDALAETVVYDTVDLPRGRRSAEAVSAALPAVGLVVSSISPALEEAWSLSPSSEGLLVTAVAQDGPAAGAGLVPGDVIVEIDQDPVFEPAEAAGTIAAARAADRHSLLVLLDRARSPVFRVVGLAETAPD